MLFLATTLAYCDTHDSVRFLNSIELNPPDELIELTVKFLVRLCSIIEPNRTQSMDCVRLSSISYTGYTKLSGKNLLRICSTNCLSSTKALVEWN